MENYKFEQWKKFIDENLFTCVGYLKRIIRNRKKFEKKFPGYYSLILKDTSFLPKDSKIEERIYCLYNNVDFKACPICKKNKIVFISFSCGYRYTCSNKCFLKFSKIPQEDGTSIVQKRIAKTAKTMSETIIDGKNAHQIKGLKGAKKRHQTKLKPDENGLNCYQRSANKTRITKHNIIIDGKNINQIAALKSIKKKLIIGEDGLNSIQRATIKNKIKKTIIGEDGLTTFQRAAKKANKTKSKIGDDGLTVNQRAAIKSKITSFKVHKYSDKLFYQGSYEKNFLDKLKDLNLLQFIKNGQVVKYTINDKEKDYYPDFVYKNIIFEIKSSWTYDDIGSNEEYGIKKRIQNNSKWLSCIKQNYRVIVIFDKKFYTEIISFNDITYSIKKDLKILTDEFLKNIFL